MREDQSAREEPQVNMSSFGRLSDTWGTARCSRKVEGLQVESKDGLIDCDADLLGLQKLGVTQGS